MKKYIEDRKMDEHTLLSCGKSISAKHKFIHYDFKDLNSWIDKLNWYATREVNDYFAFKEGKTAFIDSHNDKAVSKLRNKKFGVYYRFPLFIRCWMVFIVYYIFHLGFLDGKEGFIYHWMYHRWYRTLIDSKIYERLKTRESFEKTADLE